jgi:hypothetical protein
VPQPVGTLRPCPATSGIALPLPFTVNVDTIKTFIRNPLTFLFLLFRQLISTGGVSGSGNTKNAEIKLRPPSEEPDIPELTFNP